MLMIGDAGPKYSDFGFACVLSYLKGKFFMKNQHIGKLVLAALFLALAYVFPFVTGQVPTIGNMLCPMHIPVLLCGFVCGWQYGGAVGLVAPLLRSLTLGAPVLFPRAVCMSLELCTYGAVVGLMFFLLPKKIPYIYVSLVTAMLAGRLIWGGAMFLCLLPGETQFGFAAFAAGAFFNAIPGILLQLVLIPPVVVALKRAGLIQGQNEKHIA